jgi:Methyltransferase domain
MVQTRRRIVIGRLSGMASLRARCSRGAVNLRAFGEGWRFSKRLPSAAGTNAVERPGPVGLREYFDGYAEGPGLWKWLHYFPIYERHFARFVGRKVTVVEIGVYSGGSLSMWLHYFGAGAYVYGVDIEPACRSYASDRIDVHIGDQADPAFWRGFLSEITPIDVLIDDGGHQAHQQIATLKATLPAMSPGGVYLCEDSQGPMHPFHSFVDGLGRYLHDARGEPNPLQQHVESIHRYPLVTVIEKPLLPVPRFESPKHGTQWEPSVRV